MVVLLGLKDVKYIRCTLSSWGKQEFDREQWAGETKRGLFARVLEMKGDWPERLWSRDQSACALFKACCEGLQGMLKQNWFSYTSVEKAMVLSQEERKKRL